MLGQNDGPREVFSRRKKLKDLVSLAFLFIRQPPASLPWTSPAYLWQRLCRVCGLKANRLYKVGQKEALVQIVSTLAFLVSESGQPSQWYLSAPLHYSFAVWSNPVLALAHTESTNSPTVLCPTVIHYSNYSYLYWRPVPDQNVQLLKSDPHLTQIWF